MFSQDNSQWDKNILEYQLKIRLGLSGIILTCACLPAISSVSSYSVWLK
jgi:hypothetical protein